MIYNLVVNTYEDENLLFSLNTIGSITDNILKYSDEDNEIQISLKKALFIKENKESLMDINNQKCHIKLKDLNQTIEIPLKFVNHTFSNHKVKFQYQLISMDKPLLIDITIGDEINES